jgi:hypothetical protein
LWELWLIPSQIVLVNAVEAEVYAMALLILYYFGLTKWEEMNTQEETNGY